MNVLTALTARKKLKTSFDRSFDRAHFRINMAQANQKISGLTAFPSFPSIGS
jgi:hypothetical protein